MGGQELLARRFCLRGGVIDEPKSEEVVRLRELHTDGLAYVEERPNCVYSHVGEAEMNYYFLLRIGFLYCLDDSALTNGCRMSRCYVLV